MNRPTRTAMNRTAVLTLLLASLPAAAAPADILQTLGLLPPSGSAAKATGGALPTPGAAAAVPPGLALPGQSALGGQAAAVPMNTPTPPQQYDYTANLASDVFGANLFTGSFTREGATQFNPDYAVAVGDNIQVRFWGAFDYDAPLTVDPQGNIFVPHVGPVRVLGVRNQDLQGLVEAAVRRTYRANVYSYASLAAAQPVRVFVGGFVNRPGLYSGTSMDSLLSYLDQAGGIDLLRGSFLSVQVKRGSGTRATLNLYDFILDGRLPLIQLASGDVIFVAPKQKSVQVVGLVANAKRFEFAGDGISLAELARLAKPQASATHVRVTRNTGTTLNVDYYPLAEARSVHVHSGDSVEYTADKKTGTITVRVEGEHLSPQEYVVPYGTRLGALMAKIRYTDRADTKNLQLFRPSVAARQQEQLNITLKHLETSVLTARSGTAEEAQLRTEEAALMLQWIDRAKSIQPSGQVLLSRGDHLDQFLLESGDVLRVPTLDNLVMVSGEVMFPNTVAIAADKGIGDYVASAGGYSQKADTSRIIIAHRDGSFENTEDTDGWFSSPEIHPGDEIMVLPAVDPKYRQLFKEVATMLYQMGLGARVFLK
ncbi:polysaccharide biosynthesis/export family protein [Methylovulum psychrotolerans]|uniref:polysaccharide biosynthesis/export family protein n=1 Tax=Methylovulum psychrotolerans TaxID=1704499 RepID=UPI002044CF39|nr:polysaccharide biosynthesis/export family protein [Methylovulum psychrotolerans]